MTKELEQLKESIASLDKKYRESKGYNGDTASPSKPEMEDMMYQMISNVYRYVDSSLSYIDQWINGHSKGHIPPCSGPEKLANAIEVLGLDGDYQVEKKTIWASNLKYTIKASKKNGIRLECDLVKG